MRHHPISVHETLHEKPSALDKFPLAYSLQRGSRTRASGVTGSGRSKPSPAGESQWLRTLEELGGRLALLRMALVIWRHPRPADFENEALGEQPGHRPFDVHEQALVPLVQEPPPGDACHVTGPSFSKIFRKAAPGDSWYNFNRATLVEVVIERKSLLQMKLVDEYFTGTVCKTPLLI